MAYQSNKKRKYRIKILPVMILLLTIALLICFIVFLATGGGEEDNQQSSFGDNSSLSQSSNISSKNSSSSKSSDVISSDTTQVGGEVDASSKDLPSSEKTSSTVSSAPTSSSSNAGTGSVKIIDAKEALTDPMWNLILVNSTHQLNGDMDIQKTKFDTQYVDSRAAGAYQAMYDAAKKDGITLYLRSGYRSYSTQQTNYNADIQRNLSNGHSKEEATRLTEQYYARPGQSEHHTGLAFDIITPEYHKNIYTLNEKFAETKAYSWLIKNCADYGFILRFPKDKVDVTLINYEPWHYRYVGVEHAKEIMSKNICLEEYLAE